MQSAIRGLVVKVSISMICHLFGALVLAVDAAPYFRWGDARQKIRVWSNTWADASCYETAYLIQYSATERHVPARYVLNSQMCRQLDMSFKKAKKTEIFPTKLDVSDNFFFKSQDMSDMCRTKMKKNARHV